MPIAFLAGIGMQELLVIAGIIVLIFGATRVPQLMKGVGQGIREFKNAIKDDDAPKPPADQPIDQPNGSTK